MFTATSTAAADQCVPEFQTMMATTNIDHLQLIDDIPISYIIEKLHELGPSYLGDKSTAFAELHVEGIDKPFWVHKEYLVLQSVFFREVFDNVSNGDIVTITIPCPETFEAILEFLYNGDAQKWYNTITKDNYCSVLQNVEFLGLGTEAKDVCVDFYENEIANQ